MSNKFEYFVRKLWEMRGCPALVQDAISAITALVTAETVSAERAQERIKICAACPNVIVVDESELACGLCNCAVSERHLLLNLALYEEDTNTPKMWGCKYPSTNGTDGSKWIKGGV